jgi:hypothetical protein
MLIDWLVDKMSMIA